MRIVILVAIAVMVSTVGFAAEFDDLSPGQRIRAWVHAEGRDVPSTLRGTVLAVESGSLTVRPDRGRQAVVLQSDQVARVERLLKPSRRKKGALIGAGVLGGAMLGLFGWSCTTDWGCEGADADRVVAVVGGAAALGALIGAGAAPGDRWVDLPRSRSASVIPAGPRFRLAPTRGGGVAASLAVRLPLRRGR